MSEPIPTIEEMRPLLHPLFACVLLAADIIANEAPMCTVDEDLQLRIINGSIGTAGKLMACLVADELAAQEPQPPVPETVPVEYLAGMNVTHDEAVKALRTSPLFANLPPNIKRLVHKAAYEVENHQDQIPF